MTGLLTILGITALTWIGTFGFMRLLDWALDRVARQPVRHTPTDQPCPCSWDRTYHARRGVKS